MEISEEELRDMVRDAIARHVHHDPQAAPQTPVLRAHPSHGLLTFLGGGDAEGRCLIEPAVRCIQCGYCQSMGH